MAEDFLAELSTLLDGSSRDRERLRQELAAHLDDARACGVPERQALERLGTPETLAAEWNARCAQRRAQQRLRGVLAASVAAAASLLAVVQYAHGAPAHNPPPPETTTQHPGHHHR